MPLTPRSVAEFYWEFLASLRPLRIQFIINTLPSEVVDPIPCDHDQVHASYDPVSVSRFWRVLVKVDKVFEVFRSRFIGKSSLVHFFWGASTWRFHVFQGDAHRNAREPTGLRGKPTRTN